MNEQGAVVGQSGVHAARGSVRDGLAALQNFENLLRSPRIGPRSLGRVIGELRASCAPIGHALDVLIDDISLREPTADVVHQLAEHARSNMHRLEQVLVDASQGEFGAKVRLSLEAEVRAISKELGTLRGLVDLLESALHARTSDLEAMELLQAAVSAIAIDGSARGPIVRLQVGEVVSPLLVTTDPRVALPLVAIGVGLVAAAGSRLVLVEAASEGAARIRITSGGTSQDSTPCSAPSIIGPSLEVARMAARWVGAEFDQLQEGCEFWLPRRAPEAIRM